MLQSKEKNTELSSFKKNLEKELFDLKSSLSLKQSKKEEDLSKQLQTLQKQNHQLDLSLKQKDHELSRQKLENQSTLQTTVKNIEDRVKETLGKKDGRIGELERGLREREGEIREIRLMMERQREELLGEVGRRYG